MPVRTGSLEADDGQEKSVLPAKRFGEGAGKQMQSRDTFSISAEPPLAVSFPQLYLFINHNNPLRQGISNQQMNQQQWPGVSAIGITDTGP